MTPPKKLTVVFSLAVVLICISPFSPRTEGSGATAENTITLKFFGPNGQPIPGAKALVQADPPQETEGWNGRRYDAQADENGIAVIPLRKKEEMTYFSVRAQTPGFTPFSALWRQPQTDPIPDEYVFRLENAISVGGVVFDEVGNPLPGVNVRFTFPYADRQRIVQESYYCTAEQTTDENGRWKFESLPPEYLNRPEMFTFKHPDYQMLDKQMSISRFAPDADGEFTSSVTMQKGITVSGKVVDAEGKPIVGAKIFGSNSTRSFQPQETATDENGRFEFINWTEAQGQYVIVRADGFAPEMKAGLWVRPTMEPLEFTLKPGKTIRAKVVDPDGNPVPGVWFALECWRSQRLLTDEIMGGHKSTDAEGNFVWENAPEDEIVFDLLPDHKDGRFRCLRGQPIVARDAEYRFMLQPAIKVSAKVYDAATKDIISEFRIFKGYRYSNDRRYHWDTYYSKVGYNGAFDVSYDDERQPIFVKIEAPGYAPKISREIDLSETNVVLDFAMEKPTGETATGIGGVVHGPDGKPIQGATVALAATNRVPYIQNGSLYDNSGCLSAKTDEQGHFTLPPTDPEEMEEETDPDFKLFVMHPSGFAEISKEDFQKENQTIRLEKWGRVEGTLQLGSQPGKDKQVNLQINQENVDWRKPRAFFDYRATTDSQGRFTFGNVLPGKVTIWRSIDFAISSGGRSSCFTNGASVELKPGDTATVRLGGVGRPMVGKLALPEGFEGAANWNFSHVRATPAIAPRPEEPKELKELRKTIPAEIRTEEDDEKRKELLDRWKETEQGKLFDEIGSAYEKVTGDWAILRRKSLDRQVACAVDETGGFRLEDVAPGDWEIAVDLTAPPPEGQCGWGESLGTLQKTVTVPEIPDGQAQSDEPFDAGTLTLDKAKPQPKVIAVGADAPDFELKRLLPSGDGAEETIKLSGLRGKTVVIDFWATWCGPCLAKMPEMVRFYEKIKENPDYVLIGVSIDDDEQTLLDFLVRKSDMGWIQLRTDPDSPLTEQYGIFAVPTLIVVGPDGKVTDVNPNLDEMVPKEQ